MFIKNLHNELYNSKNKNSSFYSTAMPINANTAKLILKYYLYKLDTASNTLLEDADFKLILLFETIFKDDSYIQALITKIKFIITNNFITDSKTLTKISGNNDLFKNIFTLNDLHENNYFLDTEDISTTTAWRRARDEFPINIPNNALLWNIHNFFDSPRKYFRKRFIWHKNKKEET